VRESERERKRERESAEREREIERERARATVMSDTCRPYYYNPQTQFSRESVLFIWISRAY